MKKIVIFNCVLILSFFLKGCQGDKVNQGFEYDSTLNMITGYDISYGTDVVIPEKIDSTPIHRIGPEAFKGLGITSVILSESIWYIEEEAFSDNEIAEISINSLNYLGSSAFKNNQISSLKINEFFNAGYLPFEGNPLDEIYLGEENPFMMSMFLGFGILEGEIELIEKDGFYILPETGAIVGYDISFGTDIVIPETYYNLDFEEELEIHEILNYAFFNLGITSVTFLGDEILVSPYAFANNKLTEIDINNIEDIYFTEGAFRNNNLTEIISVRDFGISRDLFRGNPITTILIAESEDYYQGYYKFLGLDHFSDNFTSIDLEVYMEDVQDLSGIGNDENIRETLIDYQGKLIKIDFEIDQHSTKTSQKVDIYEKNGDNESKINSFIIPDYSYGLADAKVSQNGSIYALAYRIPLGADSDTYLPGVIIEIESDLSTYTIHELNNNDMRIPYQLEINDEGNIGIYGEVYELYDNSNLHCFIMYDDEFNETYFYKKDDVSRFTYQDSFSEGDNFILFTENENGNKGSIIQVFDSNGLLKEMELNSESTENIIFIEKIENKIRVVSESKETLFSILRIHDFDSSGNEIFLKEFTFSRFVNFYDLYTLSTNQYFVSVEFNYNELNVRRFLLINEDLEMEYIGEFSKYIEHPNFIVIKGEIYTIEDSEKGMNIYKILFE